MLALFQLNVTEPFVAGAVVAATSPSTRRTTDCTPTLSEAEPLTSTTPFRVLPAAGAVRTTVGGVLSTASGTPLPIRSGSLAKAL